MPSSPEHEPGANRVKKYLDNAYPSANQQVWTPSVEDSFFNWEDDDVPVTDVARANIELEEEVRDLRHEIIIVNQELDEERERAQKECREKVQARVGLIVVAAIGAIIACCQGLRIQNQNEEIENLQLRTESETIRANEYFSRGVIISERLQRAEIELEVERRVSAANRLLHNK